MKNTETYYIPMQESTEVSIRKEEYQRLLKSETYLYMLIDIIYQNAGVDSHGDFDFNYQADKEIGRFLRLMNQEQYNLFVAKIKEQDEEE